MPNQWGDPLPWERAGMSHPEWHRVLSETIRRWVASANALGDFYTGPLTFEGWDALRHERDEAYEEHLQVMRGEMDACERVAERLAKAKGDS